jgi:transposase
MPYRTQHREQDWRLPPSLGELLVDDHPGRFAAEFVDQLALMSICIVVEPASEGAPSYHPKILLSAWLYGFMERVRSSSKLERSCSENIAFMWLTALQRPDHVTLWRFDSHNRAAMRKLLKQTVQLATEVGLVDCALQAVDGSRVGSAAWDSLQNRRSVAKLLTHVEAEIAAMEQAEAAADEPDGRPPAGGHGLTHRQELRQRLRHALAALDKAQATPGFEASGTETVAVQSAVRAVKARVKVSVTDPGAVVMKSRHGYGYLLGYNGQVVVDSQAQVIVACASASGQLAPMLTETQAMTERLPRALVADAG